LATELTVPLNAASARSFTFTFEPVGGERPPARHSLGTLYVERAETIPRGQWIIGLTVVRTSWSSLDGIRLDAGDFGSWSGAGTFTSSQDYYVQTETRTPLDLTSTAAHFAASVGIADYLDIGIRLPLLHVSVSGTTERRTWLVSPNSKTLDHLETTKHPVSGSSYGLGDISIRAKANLFRNTNWAIASSLEATIPTGRAQHLLGTGHSAYKFLLLGTARSGVVESRINVGYTLRGDGFAPASDSSTRALAANFEPSDEVHYSGAIEVMTARRVSITAEFVGRILKNSISMFSALDCEPSPNYVCLAADPTYQLVSRRGLVRMAFGAKANVASWLIGGYVSAPLSKNGLYSGLTPVLTFERQF
jgi:hypothetical protein